MHPVTIRKVSVTSLYHQHTPGKVGYSPCLVTNTENMPAVVNLIGVMSNHLVHMAAGALYIISGRIISTQSGRWRSLSIQITLLFWILGSISWRDWIILSNDIPSVGYAWPGKFLVPPSEACPRSIIPGHHVVVCDLICCEWSHMCVISVCVRFVCSGMVTCSMWYKLVCTLCVWVVYYVWFVLCSRVCIWLGVWVICGDGMCYVVKYVCNLCV